MFCFMQPTVHLHHTKRTKEHHAAYRKIMIVNRKAKLKILFCHHKQSEILQTVNNMYNFDIWIKHCTY